MLSPAAALQLRARRGRIKPACYNLGMTVRIKGHFDGKTIVPDEPVNWPAGTPVTVGIRHGTESFCSGRDT